MAIFSHMHILLEVNKYMLTMNEWSGALCRLLKEKNIPTLIKVVRHTLFRSIVIGIGTTTMEFYSRGEILGSTLNMVQTSGYL